MIEIGRTAVEVAVFAVILYLVLRFLRETRGSGVVRGLALLLVSGMVGFWLLIDLLGLAHLRLLFGDVSQVIVIGLVIVFHPEIRRAIVHLGESPIFGRFFKKESKIVQRVLRAVARMSKERIGALIAVEREASLQSLAESGITIDAELNSFLIESIFYPKSALHDGAIVVRDDRIVAASCLLPLSQNPDVDKRLGTRHRAALGLSEETDALAIVVSEETGKVSAAIGGKLSYDLTLEQVERHMDEALGLRQRSTRTDQRRRTSIFAQLVADPLRKLAALALGIGLYYMLDKEISSTLELTPTLITYDVAQAVPPLPGDQLRLALPMELVDFPVFVNPQTREPLHQVKLGVTGPSYLINNVRGQRGQLVLPIALPGIDWKVEKGAEFTVAHVQRAERVLDDPKLVLTMTPERVRIEVERIGSRSITVNIGMVELVGTERLRARPQLDTAEFAPDTVQVVASATRRPIEVRIQLTQYWRDKRLRISGPPCILTMQVHPVMKLFELTVPILVDDLSLPADMQDKYRPDAPDWPIKVNLGGQLLAKMSGLDQTGQDLWARRNLRLRVKVQPREDAPYPNEITEMAILEVYDQTTPVASVEHELAESVAVILRREP
jgi:diadenylate cyclase